MPLLNGGLMNASLLFELRTKDGHVYKLYMDGRTEGFADGILISIGPFPYFALG